MDLMPDDIRARLLANGAVPQETDHAQAPCGEQDGEHRHRAEMLLAVGRRASTHHRGELGPPRLALAHELSLGGTQ